MNNPTRSSATETRISRRRFLASSTAALAMPLWVRPSTLGRGGSTAPNDRIAMGFIGLGGQGTGHLLGGAWTYVPGGYVARNDVQVVSVCDVRRERREQARQRCNAMYAQKLDLGSYEGVRAHNDFREVLDRPEIDAVLLALPYHWAAPMSIMALRAGKDVYCEKPMAITVREGKLLMETCRRFGRVYQAGTQQRSEYGGRFRMACEWVRNGRIGRLKEVYAYRQPGAFYPAVWTTERGQPVPDGFDWDLWLGPLPWRPYGGEAGHALSGCFIGDVNWSPHHYDFVHWTVNPDPVAPVDVVYEGHPDASRGEGVVQYHYANGVTVHAAGYPGESVGNEGGACLVGTEGRIAVDRNSIVSSPKSILETPLRPEDGRVYHATSHSGNFLECVKSRRRTLCDPETAVASMNSILIGGIAMALERAVKWDPSKFEFIGDPEANRLLSYPQRARWLV